MNISYPPFHITNIPPAFEQLGHEFTKASAFLLIPAELFYFSVYFHGKGQYKIYESLSLLSLVALCFSPVLAPIHCGAAKCLQNFASTFKFEHPSKRGVYTHSDGKLSCNRHHEDPRYLGASTFAPSIHSWQETSRLATAAPVNYGIKI